MGLFNTADYGKTPESYFHWANEKPKSYSFDFASIGLKGKYKLRDVWRQKDLGTFEGSFKTKSGTTAWYCCACTTECDSVETLPQPAIFRQVNANHEPNQDLPFDDNHSADLPIKN